MANTDQIKADPGFRAALARRGITDMSMIQVNPWPASNFGLEIDASGRRLARGVAYLLDGPGSNPYGFTVDDGLLTWGPWQMRVSLQPIEGLVLHQIGYLDHGRLRPIIYRASLSEMIVPYGSTAVNHWWKNAFDAGDVGLGKMANPLELGCECLGEIVYLDAVAVNEDGAARDLPQAICLHEEDYGVLWMHRDAANQAAETRGPGGWWCRPSPRSAITSTASSGISTWTARSRPR